MTKGVCPVRSKKGCFSPTEQVFSLKSDCNLWGIEEVVTINKSN